MAAAMAGDMASAFDKTVEIVDVIDVRQGHMAVKDAIGVAGGLPSHPTLPYRT